MDRNDICTDFYQIISGSSNITSRAYTEATKAADSSTNAIGYLKNFIASIENIAAKDNAIDKRICDSKGNIRNFVGYDNIEKSLKFLTANKTPAGNAIVADLRKLNDSVEKYKTYYVSGYSDNNRLLMHEYECIVYLLVTGLSMAISFSFDVTDAMGTTKVTPKAKAYFGVTGKKIHEMAESLTSKHHVEYLEQLDKASAESRKSMNEHVDYDDVYTEGVLDAVSTTVSLISSIWSTTKGVARFGVHAVKTIKNTMFGIVPLIRGVIYLSYKRKADTILSLDQNVIFLERNIEILNNKNMDQREKEKIIKKQRAKIDEYKKRAEQLRVKLEEGEKEAANAIKAEDTKMKTPADDDDDFVLEKADCLYTCLCEGTIDRELFEEKKIIKGAAKSPATIADTRKHHIVDLKSGNQNRYDSPMKKMSVSGAGTREMDIKTLEKVVDEFHKKTERDTIRLKPTRVTKDDNPTTSKIGGHPYWPEDKDYPTKKGRELILVAQINFAELPHIKDFPTKGIFQVFCEYDDGPSDDDCVFVYHEDVGKSIDTSNKPTLDPRNSFTDGTYYLTGTKTVMYMCDIYSDVDGLNEIFMNIFNKEFGTNIQRIRKIDDVFGRDGLDMVYDYISGKKAKETWGTRIGGYPNFTQNDPRIGANASKNRLLLQLDSEAGMMWGDCGIANIFVSDKDLKAGNLTNALFNWDCY